LQFFDWQLQHFNFVFKFPQNGRFSAKNVAFSRKLQVEKKTAITPVSFFLPRKKCYREYVKAPPTGSGAKHRPKTSFGAFLL